MRSRTIAAKMVSRVVHDQLVMTAVGITNTANGVQRLGGRAISCWGNAGMVVELNRYEKQAYWDT